MSGEVHFNPNLSRVSYNYNLGMPLNPAKFVSNAVNNNIGGYNLTYPNRADSMDFTTALGAPVSQVANRLDYQC